MPEPRESAPLVDDDDPDLRLVPGETGAAEPVGSGEPGGDVDDAEAQSFERLLVFLKESRGFDFTGYKRPSLTRRVRHRMRELGVMSFEAYQDVLQFEPAEFTALFNTILINVTSFFRDVEAWEFLRTEVLPDLLRAVDGAPLRVWSAGASAGHEAYSIAMLLHELMGDRFREQVKIYATDVDEHALSYARQASYGERDLAGLPATYRERYFDQVAERHVVTADIRRQVIFGRNDLTRDAPISRIDILLCRNTLMYFNAETQQRVIRRLGFALRPGGVLFLGKAEMPLDHSNAFDPIDLGQRLFRRVGSEDGVDRGPGARRSLVRLAVADESEQLRDEILLTNPVAQIAVNAEGRLVMINHRASGMLGISDRDLGRPFQDLEVSYRPLELRSHLAEVADKQTPVWLREVEWRRSGPDPVFVDVHVVPLLDATGAMDGASISFTDVTRFRQLRVEVELANRQLETAYEELQSTNEELETTNEELQSTVEELETTNEELQSTNEELETMNEELQSANDELQSSNGQLRDRTREIGDLNAFMESILGSLEAAVIVVDQDVVVQVWTPQAFDLWGLRSSETVGRHLLNLDSGLPTAELHPWIRAVITGQQPVVGQTLRAVNRRGRTVELRVTVTPLQSPADFTTGALISMEEVAGSDAVAAVASVE